MALPFGVSWLCTLLWGCICFSSQKGYNVAHGYSFNDDGFGSRAGDEMQATRRQSFVSPQREPVHHDNNEDVSSATSLREEMAQSKPDSGHGPDRFLAVPSAPSVKKYEQSPFGLLVREHTQERTMDGISFPTIKDFNRFIEIMKSYFLTPGSDLSPRFKTARDIMKDEITSNAQSTEGEAVSEGTAHVDASENEVWSEPMNTVFEQSEQGANYQMPSENLSAPDPVDTTADLISTSVYDNQGSGSALYRRPHLAATEHVSSSYGSFDNGVSGENPDIFTSAPDVQNVQSTSYKLPEQMPSGSFFGGDFSFHPSQDFSYYSSTTSNIMPLTPEKNIQQPQYTSHSKDSFTVYQKPSGGFELGEDFQSEELSRVTPANVLSAPKPPSLNSYAKSLYVNAPRGQHYIPDYVPKHRERPAQSFQAYQPTVGKASKEINYTPTVHPPAFSGSVSSSSENLLPQSNSGHVGVQTSSPHDAQNQAFSRKQPARSHQVFTVKPSSSLHGSRGHNGYLRDQGKGVTRPSVLTAQAKDEEKSDPSKQNLVSAIEEPKPMTDNIPIPISGGLDSTQSGLSSRVGDASFNSITNLVPASESDFSRLVGNEAMSRNIGIKNKISHRFPTGGIRGTRNLLGSFSNPQRRGMSLNGDYVGATRPGLLQTFIQPAKVQTHPANVIKNQTPKPLSASKVSGSTLSGVIWRNGGNKKRLLPQTDPPMSPPVNTYVVKSRSSYVRDKVFLSKTRYTPYQLDEGKTGKHQWKPAPRQQRKYKTTVGPSVNGSEDW